MATQYFASTDEMLEAIIQSPKLPEYARRLDSVLREEQEKRRQFHERLETYEGQKVEFINGNEVVHMPARLDHVDILTLLLRLISSFVDLKKLGFVGFEKIHLVLERNDYEPDICFFVNAKADRFSRKQLRFPAPDFVVEILSPSTQKIDRKDKFADYEASGVAEYWIIDPDEETVEQFVLREGKYMLNVKARTGVLESEVIAGFVMPVRAAFDAQENLQALQKILAP
ncbi:MAG: Uma2 family endonuclease [Anaerolineae bacterium]|nr:Uma2 family endonuclease [Anaerolineae bacterium]